MPNWCTNKVEIFGDEVIIEELFRMAGVKTDEIDEEISLLKTFIPASDYHMTQEGYNDGGYEWCISNWGTKWPESSVYIDGNEIEFQSPWGPRIEGYARISKKFPQLLFTHFFDEPGMAFMGAVVYQAGEVVFEEEVSGDNYPYYDGDDDAYMNAWIS